MIRPDDGGVRKDAPAFAVLVYHNVGPLSDEACRGLTVAPEAFASQLRALAAMGYSSILPRDWVGQGTGASVPSRCVMITFDDAYASLAENALPELERHGFKACVFVPTSLIGKSIACRDGASATLPLMSAEQLSFWASRGFELGAHSRSHADLSRLSDDALEREIYGSRADLAAVTGAPVTCFAYPFGRSSDAAARLVESSFDAAFTLEEGLNDSGTPIHLLRRTMVQQNDSLADVCLRARFGRSVLSDIRTRVRAAASPFLGGTGK